MPYFYFCFSVLKGKRAGKITLKLVNVISQGDGNSASAPQ